MHKISWSIVLGGLALLLFLPYSANAALKADAARPERIAVAEPRTHNGVSADEIAGISDYLESKLGGSFELYSRASLNEMLKEDAFRNSGLVLNDALKQQLEQKSVNCLLSYSVSRIGSRLMMTMMVIDASTGAVRPNQRTSFAASDFDGILVGIDSALEKMGMLAGAAKKDTPKCVILLPTTGGNGVAAKELNAFYAKLSSFILETGLFTVLGREDLQAIITEGQLAASDFADSDEWRKIPRLQAADYIVQTVISRMEAKTVSSGTAIAGATTGRVRFAADVEIRISEVKTGRIIARKTIHDSFYNTDIPAETRRNWGTADYLAAFCDRTAVMAGKALTDQLDPLLVAAVDENLVYLSRSAGVQIGAEYRISNPGKPIVHPKTGRVIGNSSGKVIAVIRVREVLDGTAVAEIVKKGEGEITVGAECRGEETVTPDSPFAAAPAASAPPAYPMAQ